ncbi:Recombination-associated protein RdgC [Candidatus Nitrotoga sp. HW29]|uniref:recombination-associated protein RdgC n=1 Tax=Candidatus Nitrotoga sp. HW29 TaxID=2886963 RepID=UPI001EF21E28|nr:recombination-associated protein RdgC [Candidatus Nitrotoga sp. HW29]CAH1903396.1 Recombination-associated protein RdgC [Candidatus Nitrotoga sp. HW29]
MWFKNLQIYRIINWNISPADLEAVLSKHTLNSCLRIEMQSRGWVSPKAEGGPLVYSLGQQMLLALGVEKKLLPVSVINQFAKLRAVEIEEQQGYKPGRKQMKEIKEFVTDELLPRAFALRRKTCAWIDPVNGWFVIDASNAAKADELVELLHKSIEGCSLALVKTKKSPASAMTEWLAGDDIPASLTIDRDCELCGTNDEKATVRYVRHALDSAEIIRHVKEGKKATRLAMTWRDKISFTLNESLQLKRIVPLDFIKDQIDTSEEGDAFDTDFAIMTGELPHLLVDLMDALGGESDPD